MRGLSPPPLPVGLPRRANAFEVWGRSRGFATSGPTRPVSIVRADTARLRRPGARPASVLMLRVGVEPTRRGFSVRGLCQLGYRSVCRIAPFRRNDAARRIRTCNLRILRPAPLPNWATAAVRAPHAGARGAEQGCSGESNPRHNIHSVACIHYNTSTVGSALFHKGCFHSSDRAQVERPARNKKPRSRPGFGVQFTRNLNPFTRCARSPARQADGVSRVGGESGATSWVRSSSRFV